jgi:Ca2+-binding EF-hand superfamily protein
MLEMDASGDGEVDYEEFAVWLSAKMKIEQEASQVFEKVDKNGSGSLDREEIRAVFLELGVVLTEEQLDEGMLDMDSDGSGEVDFAEFHQYCPDRRAEFLATAATLD